MAFDLQPILEGELLTLRPLRADDFDALFSMNRRRAAARSSRGIARQNAHRLVSLLWIRRGAERDRDWLVVSRALALGRPIQW
jgi:hypothetical protein